MNSVMLIGRYRPFYLKYAEIIQEELDKGGSVVIGVLDVDDPDYPTMRVVEEIGDRFSEDNVHIIILPDVDRFRLDLDS